MWVYVGCGVDGHARQMKLCTYMVPHGSKFGKRDYMFELIGHFLHIATLANGCIPGMGVSYDMHAGHAFIDRAYLGMLPRTQLRTVEFFRDCKQTVRFLCICVSYICDAVQTYQDPHTTSHNTTCA